MKNEYAGWNDSHRITSKNCLTVMTFAHANFYVHLMISRCERKKTKKKSIHEFNDKAFQKRTQIVGSTSTHTECDSYTVIFTNKYGDLNLLSMQEVFFSAPLGWTAFFLVLFFLILSSLMRHMLTYGTIFKFLTLVAVFIP